PTGPCFVSDGHDIVIQLQGVNLTLHSAHIAATYNASPATGLTNGLIRGFVTQADADATIIPLPAPIGNTPLAKLLPGGTGSCASYSDMDTGPARTTKGWYFYLNFTGVKDPYSE